MNPSNKADLGLLGLGFIGLVGDFKGPDLAELHTLTQTAKRWEMGVSAQQESCNSSLTSWRNPSVERNCCQPPVGGCKGKRNTTRPGGRFAAALNRIHSEHQFEHQHLSMGGSRSRCTEYPMLHMSPYSLRDHDKCGTGGSSVLPVAVFVLFLFSFQSRIHLDIKLIYKARQKKPVPSNAGAVATAMPLSWQTECRESREQAQG